jgi:ribA/ribD-fused uncharacterized protein
MIAEFQGEYRPLSNFWYKDVYLPDDQLVYSTNEHAYQAAKTDDLDIRRVIKDSKTPRDAKALGRNIDIRSNWNIERCKVMLYINRIKYTYSDMETLLLSTGTQKLVEGNEWHDNFWGICSCQSCTQELITDTRFGKNWLGKILMLIRLEIQIKKGIT